MAEPNTAPATPSPATSTPGASDVMARLEAAGIEDEGDQYEDLTELGLSDEPPPEDEPIEGAAETVEDDVEGLDEEGKPKPKPEPEDVIGAKGKGSREAPLKHKDLPADKFVEVKNAAGERVVVSLKDALSGTFMSRDVVNRHVNEAKQAEEKAIAVATKAVEHQKRANAGVQALLRNPEALVKTLVEHHMPVLHQVAKAYALMRKDPSLREGLLSAIREERVTAQGREVEQRRQALEQQEQERAEQAQLERTLKPAYRQGLKDAGILRESDITDELRDGIRMRYQFLMAKHGRMLTAAEMRFCVTDAAAVLKTQGKLKAPPRPRAVPAPAQAQTTPRETNGKKDWTKVPHEQRMRDPEFLFDRAARAQVRQSS
jgi:hypothetical protein